MVTFSRSDDNNRKKRKTFLNGDGDDGDGDTNDMPGLVDSYEPVSDETEISRSLDGVKDLLPFLGCLPVAGSAVRIIKSVTR